MVIFYPRKLGLWGDYFDFHPPITLTPKAKNNYEVFRNREELIEFFKAHAFDSMIQRTRFASTLVHQVPIS